MRSPALIGLVLACGGSTAVAPEPELPAGPMSIMETIRAMVKQVADHNAVPGHDSIISRDLSYFLEKAEDTGLVDALSGDGPFTVFAPSNFAIAHGHWNTPFSKYDEGQWATILKFHVLSGVAISVSDLADGAVLTSPPKRNLHVNRNRTCSPNRYGGYPTYCDKDHLVQCKDWPYVNSSYVEDQCPFKICGTNSGPRGTDCPAIRPPCDGERCSAFKTDVLCTNGVIHIVGGLLLPPNLADLRSIAV